MSGAVQALIGSLRAGDPNWSSVTLLLPGNGTNGAQNNTFIDSSANSFSITRNGNTTQGTFAPFSITPPYSTSTRGGSGYFDGTGDYLATPSSSAFSFGTGDYCLEAWVYLTAHGTGPAGAFSMLFSTDNVNNYWGVFQTGGNVWLSCYDGTTVSQQSAGSQLQLNTWNHVAYVKNSGNFSMYLNGTSVYSASLASSWGNTTIFYIGASPTNYSGFYFVNGYVSNARVVKGSPVYTSNFTPSTSPLTAITNTQLLLNFTNAGIIDNAMLNDLETVGNAQISTAQSKFGGSSILFDEVGDYLTVPVSTNMSLGTGDFTIECWVRFAFSTVGNGQGIYQLSNGYLNSAVRGPALGTETSVGDWTIYHGTTFTQSGTVPTAGVWYHTALVRSSGTTKLYVGGTSIISVADTTNYTDQYFVVGGWYSTGFLLNGYIDDLRITKGVARYTANFTPPAAAFPTS